MDKVKGMTKKSYLNLACFAVALGLISLVQFIFIKQVPLLADDFALKPLAGSVHDVFLSAWNMYWHTDGRIGLYLLNGFLFFMPQWLSAILRAIIPALVILVLCRIVYGSGWKSKVSGLTVIVLYCALRWAVPGYGEAFLWLTATNYSLASIFGLMALIPFADLARGVNNKINRPLLCNVAIFLAYLGVGLTDYLMAGGVLLFALFSAGYAHFYRGENVSWVLWPLIGLVVGIAILLAAPGNFVRASHFDGIGLFNNFFTLLLYHLDYFKEVILVLSGVAAIAFVALYNSSPSKKIKNIIAGMFGQNVWVLSIISIGVFLGIIFAASLYLLIPQRAMTFASMLAVAALLALTGYIYKWFRPVIIIGLGLFVLATAVFMCYEFDIYQADAQINQKRQIIISGHQGQAICLPPYEEHTSKFKAVAN